MYGFREFVLEVLECVVLGRLLVQEVLEGVFSWVWEYVIAKCKVV